MIKPVYEDNHLLVVVKPQGQLTQSDETGDLSLQDECKQYIKEKYQKPGEVYLGLVHRLDRPVGGLVAFARTSKAASRLSEQLRTHHMEREYLAVVEGESLPAEGTLCDWLLQDENTGLVRTVPKKPGCATNGWAHGTERHWFTCGWKPAGSIRSGYSSAIWAIPFALICAMGTESADGISPCSARCFG